MGINIKSSSGASIERNSVSPIKAGTLIDMNVLHSMSGHASEDVVRKIVKHYGWKVMGTFKNVKILHSPRLNVRTCQRTVVLKLLYLLNIYAFT